MKALLLSAGQGRRLLPLTAGIPKCALPIRGRSILEWQLEELAGSGVDRVTVVVGFAADHVERLLGARAWPYEVRTLYNPFFALADNLVSCWVAAPELTEDLVLINGDTLFEAAVLRRLLEAPHRPVTLAVDHKAAYDADDMKVSLDGDRLLAVGKRLPAADVHGESIGMMVFRGDGPALFRAGLDRAVRRPEALRQWYLSVIDELARAGHVGAASIHGLDWTEVDSAEDLARAEALLGLLERSRVQNADAVRAPQSAAVPSPTIARTSRRSSSVSTSTAASAKGRVTAATLSPIRPDTRAKPSSSVIRPSP